MCIFVGLLFFLFIFLYPEITLFRIHLSIYLEQIIILNATKLLKKTAKVKKAILVMLLSFRPNYLARLYPHRMIRDDLNIGTG